MSENKPLLLDYNGQRILYLETDDEPMTDDELNAIVEEYARLKYPWLYEMMMEENRRNEKAV